MAAKKTNTARTEDLRVKNYRALREVEIENLTPLTVLLGAPSRSFGAFRDAVLEAVQ